MLEPSGSFSQALRNARSALLGLREPGGWWDGELSSSALSTATAVFAIRLFLDFCGQLEADDEAKIIDPPTEKASKSAVQAGLNWLALHQNADGGWGDTVKSLSNISTTALVWAALGVDASAAVPGLRHVNAAAEGWLTHKAGGCDPARLVPAIIARYGKDQTFSVPILTMCALAGKLGQGRRAWRHVPQLPFELAAFPQRWFKWLKLPVVSYALPALIAIGLVRYVRLPGVNLFGRTLRALTRRRTLALLSRIQPDSGGFLEATPLTSFVVMSLVGAGEARHLTVRRGIDFLLRSARPDGSWPIDSNLATWVTTLSVNALARGCDLSDTLNRDDRQRLYDWLIAQQYRVEHPYTLANPGAWAWTPLPGGVPDADDTAGALLALRRLEPANPQATQAAQAALQWLVDLQNNDGGIPTFCRGWGTLPFDRSSADLTAHFIRAIQAWQHDCPPALGARLSSSTKAAIAFLRKSQQLDGSWLPLWFGNQHAPGDINPTYGVTRVLLCFDPREQNEPAWLRHAAAGVKWLLSTQHSGGGWGAGPRTPSSIEETALAVEALAHVKRVVSLSLDAAGAASSAALSLAALVDLACVESAIDRGAAFLIHATECGTQFDPVPIGFYFAKLWYFETLYPLIFTVAALEAVDALSMIAISHPSVPPEHV